MFQLALCANGMGNSVDETVQIYLLVREGEKEKSGSLNVAKIHETNAEKQSSHCIRKKNSNKCKKQTVTEVESETHRIHLYQVLFKFSPFSLIVIWRVYVRSLLLCVCQFECS